MQPYTGLENSDRKKLIEEAIKEYACMVFRIAYNNLGNYADAEDILQEVSVSLVTCEAPLNDKKHLRYWLCTVTVNKCRNFRKSKAKCLGAPLTDDVPVEMNLYSGVLDELKKLPKNYANVLYLYYYEGFSIEEIAKILHKSTNTVGSQLRRGREKLRKILIDGGYNEYF